MGGMANASPIDQSRLSRTHNSLPRHVQNRPTDSPFQRNRSRVFYESHSLPRAATGHYGTVPIPNGGEVTSLDQSLSKPIPRIVLNAPGEDKADKEEAKDRTVTPFRRGSHRWSPSHKSQDSGFSDSGDSASGGGSFTRSRSRIFYSSDDASSVKRLSTRKKGLAPSSISSSQPQLDNSLSDGEHGPNDKGSSPPSSSFGTTSNKLSKSCINGLASVDAQSSMRNVPRLGKAMPCRSQTQDTDASSSDDEESWRVEHKSVVTITTSETVVTVQKEKKRSSPKQEKRLDAAEIKHNDAENSGLRSSVRKPGGDQSQNIDSLAISTLTRKNKGWVDGRQSPIPSFPFVAMGNRPGGSVPNNMPKSSALRVHLKNTVEQLCENGASSVQGWLKDIRLMTEGECMNTLQSKPVARDFSELVVMATRNTRDTIIALRVRAHLVATEFSRLKRKLDKDRQQHLLSTAQRLCWHVRTLIGDYNAASSDVVRSKSRQQQEKLLVEGDSLLAILQRPDFSTNYEASKGDLQKSILVYGQMFASLIETMLTQEIKVIVDSLDDPFTTYSLKTSIINLATIALEGDDICKLIAQLGGVRSLLTICVEQKYVELRAQSLRALATICCVIEAIGELEKVEGVECVSEILCDSKSSEKEKSEAAGLIAQITSPWIDNNHYIQGLRENLPSLTKSLTELAKTTSSDEIFLLATAALANITFLDVQACEMLCKASSPGILIRICRENKFADSIFIKDQIVTIIANLVAFANCKKPILEPGGVVLLLCFLQVRPCLLHQPAEIAACERVQQKAAIALSRLCNDAAVAREVIDLQGIQRLTRLCKDEKERNESDAVLVACLAALRKIASACGMDEFREVNAIELVEPRLLDSFLIYSSRQESYV